MKQPISEIEKHYERQDPWEYRVNNDDRYRKMRIITVARFFCPQKYLELYPCALDIGAGEGWITKDLPAFVVSGAEISEQAKSRWDPWLCPLEQEKKEKKFELITATGVLYAHYEWELFHQMIQERASDIVITSNIKDWEIPFTGFPQIHEEEFPYREYVQKLRVFKKP